MSKMQHIISAVQKGSIAEEMDIQPRDELITVNGKKIEDIFDYQFMIHDEYIELLIRKPDQEEWMLEIEKDFEDDLGIEFENDFMDDYHSCNNNCIFCFIDQMPPGMRDTLYFKDDDSRLSFLQGNYVTMTNMSDRDLDRVIEYHLSPINISFHTTNPALRCEMLHNRFAGEIFDKLDKLDQAGIEMNGQIVLCKGINDGAELDRTISDLTGYLPALRSVSVVPVGLTKYRDGLVPLEVFTKEDAKKVIEQIRGWQEQLQEKHDSRFIYCSDEWYILAGMNLPEEEAYEGYPQLENGVGMLRLLETEVRVEMKKRNGDMRKHRISIATGYSAHKFIKKYVAVIRKKYPEIDVTVHKIKNCFFGEKITVSGLITGQDLKKQLAGKDLGECLLLPCNMLRAGEAVFLDDMTIEQLEEALQIPVKIADESGQAFVEAVLMEENGGTSRRRQIYEQTDSSHCGAAECGEINTV